MEQRQFGRYIIGEELGRGGMATVFRAEDPSFDRVVALKVLPREYLHDPNFRARFEREAKTIARLEHHAIVPVYDFGEQDGQLYLVMRYMQGGSLAQRLEEGPLPAMAAAEIITRLAPALDKAHANGIVHRDLKPGNILFDEDGKAYLADFGIARWLETTSNLTGSMIVGTPAYMSPEQVQGETTVDGRSDQYSLAVIVYEMLTGHRPYEADTPAKVLMKHILEPVPQLTAEAYGLPQGIGPALERALAKDPAARYSDTGEFASSVTDALNEKLAPPPLLAQTAAAEPTVRRSTSPTPAPTPPTVTGAPVRPAKKFTWLKGLLVVGALGALCTVAGVAAAGLGYLGFMGVPEIVLFEPTATLPPSSTPEPLFNGDLATLLPAPEEIPGGLPLANTGSSNNQQVAGIYYGRELGPSQFGSEAELAAKLEEIGRQSSYYAQYSAPEECNSPSGFTLAGVTFILHRDAAATQAHTRLTRGLVSDYWALVQPYALFSPDGDIQFLVEDEYCDQGVTLQYARYNLLVAVSLYGVTEKMDLATIQAAAETLAHAVNARIDAALGR